MSIFDRFFNLFNQIFQANPFSNTLKDLKVQTETMLQRKGEAENLLREHNAQYTLAVEALAIIQKEKESVLAELNLKNEKLEIFHNSMQEEEIAALELEIRTLEQKKSVVLIAYEEAQKKKDELEKKIKDTKIMVQEANKNFDTIDAKYQAAKIQETFSPFIKLFQGFATFFKSIGKLFNPGIDLDEEEKEDPKTNLFAEYIEKLKDINPKKASTMNQKWRKAMKNNNEEDKDSLFLELSETLDDEDSVSLLKKMTKLNTKPLNDLEKELVQKLEDKSDEKKLANEYDKLIHENLDGKLEKLEVEREEVRQNIKAKKAELEQNRKEILVLDEKIKNNEDSPNFKKNNLNSKDILLKKEQEYKLEEDKLKNEEEKIYLEMLKIKEFKTDKYKPSETYIEEKQEAFKAILIQYHNHRLEKSDIENLDAKLEQYKINEAQRNRNKAKLAGA